MLLTATEMGEIGVDLTKEHQLSDSDNCIITDVFDQVAALDPTMDPTIDSTMGDPTTIDPIMAVEQQALDAIYARLDYLRGHAQQRKQKNLTEFSADDPQALSERDSYNQLYTDDIARYDAAEHSLYFGQLIMADGDHLRIGRIGVLDDDLTSLLLDWRAPLARPFYFATPAQPENVHIRRHITTCARKVVRYTSEILSADDAMSYPKEELDHSIIGQAALIAALQQVRTGTMNDIVSTIQREQDIIIRSDHKGILVVQGGPGTGKTAVALHRAAYLMYTHRSTLERSGVLIIGPNNTFLQYVSQVLPSLGENGVLLSTIGNLFPGMTPTLEDSVLTRKVKGSSEMVTIMKNLVASSQRVPKNSIAYNCDNIRLIISHKLILHARTKARASKQPHNKAAQLFRRIIIDNLVKQYITQLGSDDFSQDNFLSDEDSQQIRNQLRNDAQLNTLFNKFWPQLSPKKLLSDFFADQTLIDIVAKSAKSLSAAEKESLFREHSLGKLEFSPEDAPLLDELAELIEDPEAASVAQKHTTRITIDRAQRTLETIGNPYDWEEQETLLATDLLTAQQLVERDNDNNTSTVAARAAHDRSWVFGHVIIDEAQELSPMAWRMVMRRIPNRWMTIVGDTAQTSEAAGTKRWDSVFTPYVNNRWRLTELTINYRTPEEIARYAAKILHQIDPTAHAPVAIRKSGCIPDIVSVRYEDQLHYVHKIYDEHISSRRGLIAFIVPDDMVDRFQVIDPTAVYTVKKSKGLEFDHVVLIEPATIISQSEQGLNDLYVAITRSTTQLTILHDENLPDFLHEDMQIAFSSIQ